MRVQLSIHDFSPTLRGPEYLFRGLAQTGIDGIELVIGLKSRWSIGLYDALSQQYGVPIVSLHQPLWAGMGLYFDEQSFTVARRLDACAVTCHPLPRMSLDHPRMQAYLRRLAAAQNKTGVQVLLENLPTQYDNQLLRRLFPLKAQTTTMQDVSKVAQEHGLGLTLDTDHLQLAAPHQANWFARTLPQVQNIHLSSFDDGKHHLPVYAGKLQTEAFIRHLATANYQGLLTLEINHPKAITWRQYDFAAIKRSVALIKSATR